MIRTIRSILAHPLCRKRRFAALCRFLSWQIGTRLLSAPVVVPFTERARLLVRRGMTGATGNVYCGLHEFPEMAFLLHYLRPLELFVDLGANIGAYSILAAAGAGARCVAVEPIPTAFDALLDNVALNRVQHLVDCQQCGVGRESQLLRFTTGNDTMNHVIRASNGDAEVPHLVVAVRPLDQILGEREPALLKIDVEGFEGEVLAGGKDSFSKNSLQAVIMETNGCTGRYGVTADDLHGQMLAHGFRACRYRALRRVLEPSDRPHMAGNTLYCRDPIAVQVRLREAKPFQVLGKVI